MYAIPAHTSGKLQPCDAVLFSVFKAALNKALAATINANVQSQIDSFMFLAMLRYAYKEAATSASIRVSFRRCGMWPLNAARLFNQPRPHDVDEIDTILSPEELRQKLEEKYADARRNMLGGDVVVLN